IDHLAKQEIVVVEKDEAGPKYKKGKGKQWKKSASPKNSDEDKLQVANSKERDVCISIGLLEWNIKESILKPKRGKKLVLRVSNKANYKTVCSQAVEKWKAFYSHLYSESDDYVLLYENGEEALFLPGSTKEFFSLERYQEELGKDYNRITLCLCTSFDYIISQGIDSDNENALLNCDIPDDHGTSIEPHVHPTPKRLKVDVAENNKQEDFQIQNDEKFAIELQQQFEEEVENSIPVVEDSIRVVEDSIQVVEDKSEETKEEFIHQASVIEHLEKKTDNSSQFFIVFRRKVPFQRVLSLWQRATKKSSPTQRLTVKYVGEDGIDTGALAREFLTDCMDNMRSAMFPDGCPVDSTYHIQNGNFRTCEQIAAVSLAQGGPSPSLFEECVYDTLVNPDIDMMKLNIDQHLTKSEKELVNKIRNDIKGNQDKILDYGYTGVIDDGHVDEIVRSIVVSLVNKRVLYLKEFMQGLALYGIDELLKKAPGLCKYYFVQGLIQDNIDANYLFSCM
ncbi:HEG-like 1, partial [Paramuricea clavata]